MFDDIDRPTAEYRLSRVLTSHMNDECRRSTIGGVIATAADNLARYDRERYAHKHQCGPVPQLALLTEAHQAVAEAGRMIRSMRASDDDHALERRTGMNVASVIDELWQTSDLIGRWIEYERSRWGDRPDAEYRLSVLAGRLEGSLPPALRALVAAAAYDWSRYQLECSAHIRRGGPTPREALVRLASESLGDAARIAHGMRGSAAEGHLEHYQRITIDELLEELEQIDIQLVNER